MTRSLSLSICLLGLLTAGCAVRSGAPATTWQEVEVVKYGEDAPRDCEFVASVSSYDRLRREWPSVHGRAIIVLRRNAARAGGDTVHVTGFDQTHDRRGTTNSGTGRAINTGDLEVRLRGDAYACNAGTDGRVTVR